jgi:protein gp37
MTAKMETSGKTGIRWTGRTWNPVQGCSKVSAGCLNCYAEALSLRYGWTPKPWAERYAELNVTLRPDRLDAPLSWGRQPDRVFVNSMSDLHHRLVPTSFLDEVYARMALAGQHTYQVLTKRPERQRDYLLDPDTPTRVFEAVGRRWATLSDRQRAKVRPVTTWPLPNVWVGTSVEDHRVVDRIRILQETPAAVRFLSVEPMIGPLRTESGYDATILEGYASDPALDFTGIAWVIVGGESGPKRRPFDHAWAREVRDATLAAGGAFFFKQDAGTRTELRPYLVEADGRRTVWEQYPGEMTPPLEIPDGVDIADSKALDRWRGSLVPVGLGL